MIRYDKINRKTIALEQQLAEISRKYALLEKDNLKTKRVLNSTLHEIRRFSNELSSYSEHFSKQLEATGAIPEWLELCDTIFYTSGMLSARLAFTDMELNPAAVKLQMHFRTGIYKKFEKAGHVLSQKARLRHVAIQMKGQSFLEIEGLPAFELLPFVILDNAIKYSPPYQTVYVQFEESAKPKHFEVTVTSIGPYLEPDETVTILESGKRGKNAEKSPVSGEGLGLYLAHFLCGYHDLRLTVASNLAASYDIKGIPYAPFTVRISTSI